MASIVSPPRLPPPSSTRASVKLYPEPSSGVAPILSAIKSARTSIDLSCYLLADGNVLKALYAAAARGVKVRVMLEPKPIENGGKPDQVTQQIADLRKAGIDAQVTPPTFDSHYNVDHAKFFVTDGKKLLLGDGNLVPSGLGDGGSETDRDFWISDTRKESVSEAEQLFQADWTRTSSKAIDFKNLVVTPDNGRQKLLALIDGAQHRLWVYNQELKDPTVLQHLIAAKKRGVDVEVLTAAPHSAGETDVNAKAVKQLLAAGIPTKELKAPYMHAKAMLADGQAFIGSQNFSWDGLDGDRELGDVTSDASVVALLAQTFKSDQAAA